MRALILARSENVYGTDPTPANNTHAILTTEPTFEVIGKTIARNVVMSTFGTIGRVNIGEGLRISFTTELAGSGNNATAPRIDPLLKAMSFTGNTGANNTIYTPNSDFNTASCTIYFYYDGRLHKLMGCVGESMKINAKASEFGTIEFTMRGLYASDHASDVALPVGSYNQAAPPVCRSANVVIGAYTPVAQALSLEVTNTVSPSYDINSANAVTRVRVTQREVKGTLDPEVVALSSWNPWTLWHNATESNISLTIGNATGNRLVITANNAQPSDPPKYSARENIPVYTYGFVCNVTLTAGNTELNLTYN